MTEENIAMEEAVEKILKTPTELRIEKYLDQLERVKILGAGFRSKSSSDMAKESEGLYLSPEMLERCRSYASSIPTGPAELFFLNALIESAKNDIGRYSPTELTAFDACIADTYKDMMDKYRTLYPDYKHACNLSQMLSLAGDAVSFGSYREYSPSVIVNKAYDESYPSRLELIMRGLSPLSYGKKVAVCRRIDAQRLKCRYGSADKVALVYSKGNEERVFDFFEKNDIYKGVSGIFSGAPAELLSKLINEVPSLNINANAVPCKTKFAGKFAPVFTVAEGLLTDEAIGSYVVAVIAHPKKLKKLAPLIKCAGLEFCECMSVHRKKELFITAAANGTVRISTELLRILLQSNNFEAVIPMLEREMLEEPSFTPEEIYSCEGDTVLETVFDPTAFPSPFHASVYALTATVLSAAKRGYTLKNGKLYLTLSATVAKDSEPSSVLTSIIGLYRAQASLGIENESVEIRYGDETAFSVSVRAYSRAELAPLDFDVNALTASNLDADRLPDLDGIAKFLRGEVILEKK